MEKIIIEEEFNDLEEELRKIADKLKELDRLVCVGKLRHSYPHSWRSKAPLIFRNTPQWFISMEKNKLRNKALKSIDETSYDHNYSFIPIIPFHPSHDSSCTGIYIYIYMNNSPINSWPYRKSRPF